MVISLLTATWHYNLWDELILLQEYKILNWLYPRAKFNIFTYDKESSLLPENKSIKYVTYSPINMYKKPFSNIKYLFDNIFTIAKSDIIIIWWGWLIYEKEKQWPRSPIFYRKLRIFLSKLFNKKIVWLAIWIAYNEKNINKIKFLFSWKKTRISVRDMNSKILLKKIWIEATLINDPVFTYDSMNLDNKDSKKIWISVRKWYLKDEMENLKQIVLYLSRKWYDIIFISHSVHEEDFQANDYLFIKDLAKTYNIQITKTLKETLEIYPKLKFVIGMRLHSLILSTIHNIPFLAISYGVKTDELLKNLNYNYQINPKTFEFEKFIKIFLELESKENDAKFALKAKYDTIKGSINLEYNNFFNGLELNKR